MNSTKDVLAEISYDIETNILILVGLFVNDYNKIESNEASKITWDFSNVVLQWPELTKSFKNWIHKRFCFTKTLITSKTKWEQI